MLARFRRPVSGLTVCTGDTFARWRSSLFVGGLRQGEVPRTGQLQRIVFNDKWEEIRREPLLRGLGQRPDRTRAVTHPIE